MALHVVLVLVLGSKLAFADKDPGHGRRLKKPVSLLVNPEEQAWIDAQLLKTNYARDDPRGLYNTIDLLKESGGAGRVKAALQTLQWDFKISPENIKKKMTEPRHVHPHSMASDITVSVLRKSSKRTGSTSQTKVSQNTSFDSGKQKSAEASVAVAARHVKVVERVHQPKVASVWQKPAVKPTEHAVTAGKIKEVSHVVPQAQSAAQGQKEHKDVHKDRVTLLRRVWRGTQERQAALRKEKHHKTEVDALRTKLKSVTEKQALKTASALKKLDDSKSKSKPGEKHDSNADDKVSESDGLKLKKYYLAGDAESMKKFMQLMLKNDGVPRVESAFSELHRLGYDALKVHAWMDHARHSRPPPQRLDEIVARKAKLSVGTKATSSEKVQLRKAEKQSLALSREKISEPTSEVAEQADNQAEIDAQLFEGDIIGSDSNGMKDVMELILSQGGQQRLAASLAALESRGYDSAVVESWLAGKTGPPVKEQNMEGSTEEYENVGSTQLPKEEEADKHAGSGEAHAGEDSIVVFKASSIHPWGGMPLRQNPSGTQAVDDASRIEAHMGKYDGAALKLVLKQLLSAEGGQDRMAHAIDKLQEKGYSQDELQELFMSHQAKQDAPGTAFLQMPGSVTRKALRSVQ